jgi:hypothetical protein
MYDYLLKHPDLFPAVLGITAYAFDRVVQRVHPIMFRIWKTKALDPRRKRAVGGGRKRVFATEASLVFLVLFYYKVYPTFRLAQVVFELDKKNIWYWVTMMKPVVQEALGKELVLPATRVRHMGELLTVCPDLAACIVDATEQKIRRPQDPRDQEQYYSGKKSHTVKRQILVHPTTHKILAVSPTVEGKRHDKKLCEDDAMILRAPPGSIWMGDNGYQGAETINTLITFVYPTRKPKGKELTQTQKKTNTIIARIRIHVEHPFAWMKHFNVLAQTWRNRRTHMDTPFQTLAALYNFTR